MMMLLGFASCEKGAFTVTSLSDTGIVVTQDMNSCQMENVMPLLLLRKSRMVICRHRYV